MSPALKAAWMRFQLAHETWCRALAVSSGARTKAALEAQEGGAWQVFRAERLRWKKALEEERR